MFTKLLLASDGSDYALRAAQAAAAIAKSMGASVTVLHVFSAPLLQMTAPGAPGMDIDPGAVNDYMEQVQDSVARRTGRILEEAGVAYDTLTEVGHPAEVITRIAEDDGYDLIVLGSRGMTPIKSFLLGSVSDKVSHHAHCPVLIVK
ncbi:MAG: universal stress protein [Chthonomonadales bacterium]|nr:universal stress protein [Chthonomonadales bacterium]